MQGCLASAPNRLPRDVRQQESVPQTPAAFQLHRALTAPGCCPSLCRSPRGDAAALCAARGDGVTRKLRRGGKAGRKEGAPNRALFLLCRQSTARLGQSPSHVQKARAARPGAPGLGRRQEETQEVRVIRVAAHCLLEAALMQFVSASAQNCRREVSRCRECFRYHRPAEGRAEDREGRCALADVYLLL